MLQFCFVIHIEMEEFLQRSNLWWPQNLRCSFLFYACHTVQPADILEVSAVSSSQGKTCSWRQQLNPSGVDDVLNKVGF